MEVQSDKTARVFFLYKKLRNGYKFTTEEAYEMIEKEFGTTSLRTIQRDLNTLLDLDEFVYTEKDGKKTIWIYDRSASKITEIIHFEKNELLSLHILKAHLKAFQQTVIEDEINRLTKKLDLIAPNDIFVTESLYWDQNFGYYDYTQLDPQIRRIIKYISEKQWLKINYYSKIMNKQNSFIALLRGIFQFAGTLYVIAYVPHHNNHISLVLQDIEQIEAVQNIKYKIPRFDFRQWSKKRFGVFYGKVRKVVLKIDKDYKHYFENRLFHPSQQFSTDLDGNLILTIRVPLGRDFRAWILSWGKAITVLKPVELIKHINLSLRNTLKNYE